MRRPLTIRVGIVGLAVVGFTSVVLTFFPWYWQGRSRHQGTVSGWSHLLSRGFSFDAPVHGTYVRGPTGAVTILAGLALSGVSYAAWWLSDTDLERQARPHVGVRVTAGLVGVLASLALLLPLAVASSARNGSRVITEVPRTLTDLGFITLSVLLAFAVVPRKNR